MGISRIRSGTYILVACIGKDYDWKALKCRNKSTPSNYSDRSPVCHGISLRKVVNDQDYEVSNGY